MVKGKKKNEEEGTAYSDINAMRSDADTAKEGETSTVGFVEVMKSRRIRDGGVLVIKEDPIVLLRPPRHSRPGYDFRERLQAIKNKEKPSPPSHPQSGNRESLPKYTTGWRRRNPR